MTKSRDLSDKELTHLGGSLRSALERGRLVVVVDAHVVLNLLHEIARRRAEELFGQPGTPEKPLKVG